MTAPARTISLALAQSDVTITFESAVASGRVMLGKTPDEAVRLVGLVHNLCAHAHRAACRAATGLSVPEDAAGEVMLEILREHLVILCRSAPPLLGLAPMSLPVAFSRLGAAFAPGGASLLDTLFRALLGAAPGANFSPSTVLSAPLIGPLFQTLAEQEKALGLHARDFALPCDPTFFARVARAPDFAMPADAGPLSERLMGRIYEVHRILTGQDAQDYAPRVLQPGVARVAAARGTLVHRAQLEGGVIAAYAIETPTDLMLSDAAPLACFLEGLARAPGADEALIRLALLAFDPCVPFEIEVRARADGGLAHA